MKPAPKDPLKEALAQLLGAKQAQRALLEQQIAALQALEEKAADGPAPADVVLSLYLDMRSAKDVAEFCNATGWRMPGAKGQPRMYSPVDVYSHVRGNAPPASAVLRALARGKLDGGSGMAGGAASVRFS